MQASYVNFNPEIYNGNIQIVFFYNLDNLNLSNGQTPIKRIPGQGHRKRKTGALPFAWASILPYCSFFKLYISDPSPFYFLYHFSFIPSAWDLSLEALSLLKMTFWTPPPPQ